MLGHRKLFARGLLLALLAAPLGCGGASGRQGEPGGGSAAPFTGNPSAGDAFSAPWRSKPPAPGPRVPFVPPNIQEARLSNGIRVLLVEQHSLPIVAMQIVTDRGAAMGGPGTGAFAADMLMEGTRTKSALALSDAFADLGALASTFADHDGMGLRLQVTKPNLDEALALAADVVKNPRFAPAEVERQRARRLTALEQQKDVPAALLGFAVASALYPDDHPYARTLLGTAEALRAATPGSLRAFYDVNFRPDRVTVAVAGDVTPDEAKAALEKALGDWKGKGGDRRVPGPPKEEGKERLTIVDRPGASQSNVAVALVGVPRKTDDFDALLVLNTILGGQFSSRLNLNLREQKGYSYGVRSGFDMRAGAGPFVAGGAVKTEPTADAVREILNEIERVRKEPVGGEELSRAKTNLVLQLPARFETAASTAETLANLAIYDLPLDELRQRAEKIEKVSSADVQRVAQKYLRPDALEVVVVGDAAAIGKDLGALGLGEPVVVEPEALLGLGADKKAAGGALKPPFPNTPLPPRRSAIPPRPSPPPPPPAPQGPKGPASQGPSPRAPTLPEKAPRLPAEPPASGR